MRFGKKKVKEDKLNRMKRCDSVRFEQKKRKSRFDSSKEKRKICGEFKPVRESPHLIMIDSVQI